MFSNLFPVLHHALFRHTTAGWKIPSRVIRDYELVVITGGEGFVEIVGKTYLLKTGSVLLFAPDSTHSLWVESPPYMEFYAAHFFPENEISLPTDSLLITCPISGRMKGFWEELLTNWGKADAHSAYRCRVSLQEIFLEIDAGCAGTLPPMQEQRIRKAVALLDDQFGEPHSISSLTAFAGIQKSLFIRQFRAVTGMTPMQYLLAVRLQKARSLLLEQPLPLREIARLCGFYDEFHLNRMFKREFGVSPRRYQMQLVATELVESGKMDNTSNGDS